MTSLPKTVYLLRLSRRHKRINFAVYEAAGVDADAGSGLLRTVGPKNLRVYPITIFSRRTRGRSR
jgi:hypothetical protein